MTDTTSMRRAIMWAAALTACAVVAGCAGNGDYVSRTPRDVVNEDTRDRGEPSPSPSPTEERRPEPEPVNVSPVVVFEDDFNATYNWGDFIGDDGSIDYDVVADGLQITYNTNEAVAYFQSIVIKDFSDYTALEFDIKVVADPRADRTWFIKMDSGWPLGSEDFAITLGPVGTWVSYSIPLADLVDNRSPGGVYSSLDLSIVNTPLVLHSWGNMQGVVMVVNNVRIIDAGSPHAGVPGGDTAGQSFRVGDCADVMTLPKQTIPCNQSHYYEVYAAFEASGSDDIWDQCYILFDQFVGIDYWDSAIYLNYWEFPSSRQGNYVDAVCAVYVPDEYVTGSLAGANR